jgi:gluconate 5-dehydrogenase
MNQLFSQLFSMEEKVVVITGGSGFLGTVMIKALAEMGAYILNLDKVEPHINDVGSTYVKCDLSNKESIQDAFKSAHQIKGKIDVLINNAYYGAGYGPKGKIDRLTDEEWIRGVDGTIGVTFRCTREVIPYMEAKGKGNIINISSVHGMVAIDPTIYGDSGLDNPANYATGKAAIIQLTRYCAINLASKGIRVNCISPGSFLNDHESLHVELANNLKRQTILNRIGKPEEFIGAVLLLASNASSYITGANIVVDGGWSAR